MGEEDFPGPRGLAHFDAQRRRDANSVAERQARVNVHVVLHRHLLALAGDPLRVCLTPIGIEIPIVGFLTLSFTLW